MTNLSHVSSNKVSLRRTLVQDTRKNVNINTIKMYAVSTSTYEGTHLLYFDLTETLPMRGPELYTQFNF
jgi:hypothetical protein